MKKLWILIFSQLISFACQPSGEEGASSESDPELVPAIGRAPQASRSNVDSTNDSSLATSEDFVIIEPGAFVNSNTFTASWTVPKDLRDYDVMLSLTESCNLTAIDTEADYKKQSRNFGPLEEGEYFICVQAIINGAKNRYAKNSPYKVTIDLSPPGAATIEDIPSPSDDNAPLISWSSVDDAVTYELAIARDQECELVEQSYIGLTETSYEIEELDNGSYYACLYTVDEAGNKTDAENQALSFAINTSAAKISTMKLSLANGSYKEGVEIEIDVLFNKLLTISEGSEIPSFLLETGSTDRFATFKNQKDENILTFSYTVQAGDNISLLAIELAQTQIDFKDRSLINSNGEDETATAQLIADNYIIKNHSVEIDTTDPAASIETTPSDPSTIRTPDFVLSCDDEPCTYKVRVDGGAWILVDSEHQLASLSDGSHTYEAKAIDAAGNEQMTTVSYAWTIDATAPESTITNQPASLSASSSASFEFSCNDSPCTYEYRLDDGSWTSATSPLSLSSIADGSHTFEVRASDTLGNQESPASTYSWTIDTTDPDTTITVQPNDPDNNQTPSFSFSCDDEPCTFEYQIDAGGWNLATSPLVLGSLAEGNHTFQVRAIDQAGNVDGTPASYTWEVDITLPNSSIDSNPPDPTSDNTPDFVFNCDDLPCTYEYRIDAGSWQTLAGGVSSVTLATLADGNRTLEVRATDAAGNVETSFASYTFEVDSTEPETTFDTTPTDPTSDDTPSFAVSCDDVPCTFEGRLDGGAWGAITASYDLSNVEPGSHTFEVRATDSAGNVDLTPASFTWETRWIADQWVWIKGSNLADEQGDNGSKGTPQSSNKPGGLSDAATWVSNGELFLFGGSGFDDLGNLGSLNGVWRFDGSDWTWIAGERTRNAIGVYGTTGVPHASNIPPAWHGMASAKSGSDVWLFSGMSFHTEGVSGRSNDLWKYNGSNWSFESGAKASDGTPIYGTRGSADANNIPGARTGSGMWVTSTGVVWIFGGEAIDDGSSVGEINDLWKFESGEWTWVKGAKTIDASGDYGLLTVTASTNTPGARRSFSYWIDASDNLWLFGGIGRDENGDLKYLNDLWKFDGTDWTWVSGAKTGDQAADYGVKGVTTSSNVPGNKAGAKAWVDSGGNFWLFGGRFFDGASEVQVNDLWKFDGSDWTYMAGPKNGGPGSWGSQGVSAASNVPSNRSEPLSWFDNRYLWLFGGHGEDSLAVDGKLNDFWLYSPQF